MASLWHLTIRDMINWHSSMISTVLSYAMIWLHAIEVTYRDGILSNDSCACACVHVSVAFFSLYVFTQSRVLQLVKMQTSHNLLNCVGWCATCVVLLSCSMAPPATLHVISTKSILLAWWNTSTRSWKVAFGFFFFHCCSTWNLGTCIGFVWYL